MEEEKSPRSQNSNSNSEEPHKNEEYLLGFTSQYKPNIYKEEEVEEDIKEPINEIKQLELTQKLSSNSTCISLSQEYNNFTEKKQNDLSIDHYDNKRKLSSPLFDYFKGSDKYLSRLHPKTIDIRHSHNYIRKENYFSSNKKLINNKNNIFQNNINDNNINKRKQNNNDINNSNRFPFNNNINNGHIINTNLQISNSANINNINNYNNNFFNNNYLFPNNSQFQNIYNINYINMNDYQNNPRINSNNFNNKRKMTYSIEDQFIVYYFNNILNNNIPNQTPQYNINLNPNLFSLNEEQNNPLGNSNKKNKKNNNDKGKKKPFDKRKGDWRCPKCKNLNFAFRKACNRCQIPKPDNIIEDED